jgi:hypothetical protein
MRIRQVMKIAKRKNVHKSRIRHIMKLYNVPSKTMSVGQIYNIEISINDGKTWKTVSCGDFELIYKPKDVSISANC